MLSAPFLLPLTSLIQRGEKGGTQLEGRPHSLTYLAVVEAGISSRSHKVSWKAGLSSSEQE